MERAVLQDDPHVDSRTVIDMKLDDALRPFPRDKIRRKHAPPRRGPAAIELGCSRLLARRVHTERLQHRDQGLDPDRDVPTSPIPVLGRHPERSSQLDQDAVDIGHGTIQAHNHAPPRTLGRTSEASDDRL